MLDRIYKKCIIAILLTNVFFVLIANSQNNQIVQFKKVARHENLPLVFSLLDNFLEKIYIEYYREDNHDVNSILFSKYYDNDSLYYETSRRFAHVEYYPREYQHRYFVAANSVFESYNRNRTNHKSRIFVPSAAYFFIKNLFIDKLPWDWQFYFANRYILVVRVLIKQDYTPGLKGIRAPYYKCEILEDIKGNFRGDDISYFVGNYTRRKMEENKEYLILVWGKSSKANRYLIRGHATKGEGIFPIADNVIQDPHGRLIGLGHYKINLEEYKKIIKDFLNKKIRIN